MFFEPSILNSKGDEILKVSSKLSLRNFIRLLIGDAACQMKTAMLFKSPDYHFHISLILRRNQILCVAIPAGYHPGRPYRAQVLSIANNPLKICANELKSDFAVRDGVSAGSSPSLNWLLMAITMKHVPVR